MDGADAQMIAVLISTWDLYIEIQRQYGSHIYVFDKLHLPEDDVSTVVPSI